MNKIRKLKSIALILVFILVLIPNFFAASTEDYFKIISPTYFDEEDLKYENIHYIEDEFLSFEFCPKDEIENLEAKIVCELNDDHNLYLNKNNNKEGCFFSNFNLEKVNCDDFSLEINYESNKKKKQIKRTFEKEKQSKLINYVLGVDYKLLNPVDLSYYLIVQNNIESINSKISNEAYDKLKKDRDNSNKCWNSGSCSIANSAKILRNLKLAQYSQDTRLLEDGKNYLEKKLISNSNNPLDFVIELDYNFENDDEEISCTLKIDGGSTKTYEFDNDSTDLEKTASEEIIFNCNTTIDTIEFTLKNANNNTKASEEYTTSKGFTYNIESFSCVGTSNRCDFTSTINTLNAYGNSIEDSSLLKEYIDSEIIIASDGSTYLDTGERFEDGGKYLLFQSNNDIADYLKYKQNNDGSWGTGSGYDKIVETSWAILGLQKEDGKSEYTQDGEKWIYYNEPNTGWGSIEKNSLAYLAIKEQIKPYLKINSMNSITKWANFEIENPTIHKLKNLKLILSDEIKPFVSYSESLGDLEGEDNLIFNITVNEDFYGENSGTIKITGIDGKNKEITLVEFPINIKGPNPITLLGGNYSITEDSPNIFLKIQKNIPTFELNCKYKNSFNGVNENIILTQNSKNIELNNELMKEGNFNFSIECSYDENKLIQKTNFSVSIAEKTFEPKIKELNLYSFEDFSIIIDSTITDRQVLTFDFEGDYKGTIQALEKTKLIAGNDSRDIFFTIPNPLFLEALGNLTSGHLIINSDTGYIKKIPIHLKIGEKNEESNTSSWVKWTIGIIILIFIFLGIRFYQYKKNLEEHENKHSEYEEEIDLEDF